MSAQTAANAAAAAAARPLIGHVDTTRLHMTKAFNAVESVEQHYTSVAATYRNPHFQGIKKALFVFLNRWYQAEGQTRFDKGLDAEGDELDAERRSGLAVVDLACGSGEVVECFEEWHRLGRGGLPSEEDPTNSGEPASVTPMTAAAATTVAAPAQQRQQQATTTIHPALLTNLRAPLASRPAFIPPNRRRPAAPATSSASSLSTTNAVSAAGPSSSRAISPAASVTAFPLTVPAAHTPAAKARDALNGGQYASLVAPLPLAPSFTNLELLAVDPFTLPAFLARHPSHEPVPLALSFADVTAGGLPLPKSYSPTELYPVPKYDMVVCSFALNLAEAEDERAERWEGRSKSLAWKLIWELSTKAEWLVVLGANKRPEIGEGSGWARWDLANWQPAALSSLPSTTPDAEEEEQENLVDSAVEVRRDRVRLRVYRSVLGSA